MCYSLLAEQYMKDEYENHQDYWEQYNIAGPWYHFGSYSGLFRIYPGRPMKDCGTFPTLYRPWYVGASAGRKDVVILVDVMTQGRDKVTNAIKRVVDGLGYGDYFKIIDINLNATVMSDESPYLVSATLENKEMTLDQYSINSNDVVQERTGPSKGFELVMEALQKSKDKELTSDCHRAILYLTDAGEQDLTYEEMSNIRSIMNETKMKAGDESNLSIFTYSLGVGDDNKFVKELACENNGISHSITDFNMLEASMGTYFEYFSYGLGDGLNHDYVAWSEPYLFATGDQLGTTVSAPVYDTSVKPNVLIGIVGLDIWLHVLEKAARDGTTNTEEESNANFVLNELAERSVPYCPFRELTESELQGLRLAEGPEAVCENQAEPDKMFVRDVCDHFKDPLDVYANLDYENLDHDERSCCCLDKSSTNCEFNHTLTQSAEGKDPKIYCESNHTITQPAEGNPQSVPSDQPIDDNDMNKYDDNDEENRGNDPQSEKFGRNIVPFAVIGGLIAFAFIILLVLFLYIRREGNPAENNVQGIVFASHQTEEDNFPGSVDASHESNISSLSPSQGGSTLDLSSSHVQPLPNNSDAATF